MHQIYMDGYRLEWNVTMESCMTLKDLWINEKTPTTTIESVQLLYKVIDHPKDQKVIWNQWIFDAKLDGQKKACLVVKGFSYNDQQSKIKLGELDEDTTRKRLRFERESYYWVYLA